MGSEPPVTCSPLSCPFHLAVVAPSRPRKLPLWENFPPKDPSYVTKVRSFPAQLLLVMKVSSSEKSSFTTLSPTATLYYITLAYFHHLNWSSLCVIIYLLIDCLFPLEWQPQEHRDLSCPLLYPQYPAWCLMHSSHSINVYWMNSDPPSSVFPGGEK